MDEQMTQESNNTVAGGSLLPTLLLVLFIGLKLTHYIDWSWWWIFSPIWIPFGVIICAFILVAIILGIVKAATK